MKELYPAIRSLGGEVLAVTFTGPAQAAAYLERFPLPFTVAADPERVAYRAFGLEKTSWADFFRPGVLLGYFRLLLRGWLPWQAEKGADLLQLGGDFVLNAQRQVVFAYRSAEPTDRPAARQLLDAVRAAVAEGRG